VQSFIDSNNPKILAGKLGINADRILTLSKPHVRQFYERNSLKVCRDLLGSILVYREDGETLAGFIVETEAYRQDEPACHAYRGKTKRNGVMFGPGGVAYIYFVYGMYWCLNATTESDGKAAACLIRSVEPFAGIEKMMENRKRKAIGDLCRGPGRLAQAFNLTGTLNGHDLSNPPLQILALPDGLKPRFKVGRSTRVGINVAQELEYRYFIDGNPFVSKHYKGSGKRKKTHG
jgi:DNA-3-methyladenine glycosylase